MNYTRIFMLAVFVAGSWPFASWAYTISTDETSFQAMYGSPIEILKFDMLVDGTTYEETRNFSSQYVLSVSSAGYVSVRENAFSPTWLFRSAPSRYTGGGYEAWTAVQWYGQFITPDNQLPYFSIYRLTPATPLAFYTEPNHTGFFGIIPNGPGDVFYEFNILSVPKIYEIQTYSPVPAPASIYLLVSGIMSIFGVTTLSHQSKS